MTRSITTACLLVLVGLCAGTAALRSEAKSAQRSEPKSAQHAEAKTIELDMIDYRFVPDHLTFEHGVHYRLHMENHGRETHELTAPIFFAAAEIDNPEVLNRDHTEIVMQPGDKKDLFFTANKAGTYDLRCSDHDWDGMVGGITVN